MPEGKILLTVSGAIDPEVEAKAARGERPLPDYVALARDLGAELWDHPRALAALGRSGRWLRKVAGANATLAFACFRERADVRTVITDGEHVGIPLALMLKCFGRGPLHTKHVMIAHRLSIPKKKPFFDWLRLQSHVDTFLVYASAQKEFIQERWGLSDERVRLIPFQVDTDFYSPATTGGEDPKEFEGIGEGPMICAVGLERRDYRTLLRAVAGLPVKLVITASSAWSKQLNAAERDAIPDNVVVRRFSYPGLRRLYAKAAFMVLPLEDVDFQAGVTAILEAMAMRRAVVCTRASGQTDVIAENETGLYVPPGDAEALRRAIVELIGDPARAARMGERGRAVVEDKMSLRRYADWFRSAGPL